MRKYPNYITFAWQRCGDDCDYEIVGTLNGETFDEIIHRKMSDREINRCRMVYFRK